MLESFFEDRARPSVVEAIAWEARSIFPSETPAIPVEEFSRKVMMFYGGATEMVPSLEDRGGWQLVLRRSGPRYLNVHHKRAENEAHHALLPHDKLAVARPEEPLAVMPSLTHALLELARSSVVKAIDAEQRLDPAMIDNLLSTLLAILQGTDVQSVAQSTAIMNHFSSTRARESVHEDVSTDVTQLMDQFLSLPPSLADDQEILAAADALLEGQADRLSEDLEEWAERLSSNLSQHID